MGLFGVRHKGDFVKWIFKIIINKAVFKIIINKALTERKYVFEGTLFNHAARGILIEFLSGWFWIMLWFQKILGDYSKL